MKRGVNIHTIAIHDRPFHVFTCNCPGWLWWASDLIWCQFGSHLFQSQVNIFSRFLWSYLGGMTWGQLFQSGKMLAAEFHAYLAKYKSKAEWFSLSRLKVVLSHDYDSITPFSITSTFCHIYYHDYYSYHINTFKMFMLACQCNIITFSFQISFFIHKCTNQLLHIAHVGWLIWVSRFYFVS